MSGLFYDLHIHSCLSPCGDEDMTPNNIVNMALLKGLNFIAVTDHNSCKNCPAVLEAANDTPLTVLPGMELTTAEEIHLVFLFPKLEQAMAFDQFVYERLLPVKNDPAVFGHQLILDAGDNPVGEEPLLLINATSISVDDAPSLATRFGGLVLPAHIDRPSNSILSALGFIPPELGFTAVEVADPAAFFARPNNLLGGQKYRVLTSSDAHRLGDIAEPEHTLPLKSPTFEALATYLKSPVD